MLFLFCHLAAWAGERGSDPFPAGSEVLRERALSLRLISPSFQERERYANPEQHSRADPEGVGVGDLSPRT